LSRVSLTKPEETKSLMNKADYDRMVAAMAADN
jgi:hypothetical protein